MFVYEQLESWFKMNMSCLGGVTESNLLFYEQLDALSTWLVTKGYENEHNGADEEKRNGSLAMILVADHCLPVRRLSCHKPVVDARHFAVVCGLLAHHGAREEFQGFLASQEMHAVAGL